MSDCHAHAGEPHAVGRRAEDAELAAAVGAAWRCFQAGRERGEYAAFVAALTCYQGKAAGIVMRLMGGR